MEENEEEMVLTFRVPNTDFDYVDVDLALKWVSDQLARGLPGGPDIGAVCAHKVLRVILARYEATEPTDKKEEQPC